MVILSLHLPDLYPTRCCILPVLAETSLTIAVYITRDFTMNMNSVPQISVTALPLPSYLETLISMQLPPITTIVNSNTANPTSYSNNWFTSTSSSDSHGSAGSVRINTGTTSITSITLKVFLRSNGLTYDPNKGPKIVAKEHWAPAEDTGGYVGDGNVLTLSLQTYTISGTVYRDGNGLTDNTVNGTATQYAGGTVQLYVSLVDKNNNVFASTPVSGAGTYSFVNVVSSSNYKVVFLQKPL